MGFFDGLTGKTKTPQFDIHQASESLPFGQQEQYRSTAANALDRAAWNQQRGETPEEQAAAGGQRANALQGYQDSATNQQTQLNRAGMSSSGQGDKARASLAMGLGNLLTQQDAQRAAHLLSVHEQGAKQGAQLAGSLANSATLVPINEQKGLFDGMGTRILAGGINMGIDMIGNGPMKQMGGMMGGMGGGGGGGIPGLGGAGGGAGADSGSIGNIGGGMGGAASFGGGGFA